MDLILIILVIVLLSGGFYNHGYAAHSSGLLDILLFVIVLVIILRLLGGGRWGGGGSVLPVLLACGLFVSGCSTQSQQNISNFANSPAGQQVIATTVSAILDAALNAGDQYVTTGTVDPTQVGQFVIGDAVNHLRALRGTPAASKQLAIVAAVTAGGGSPSLAPSVANQVIAAEKQGIPPDQAIDAAINALQQAPRAALKRNLWRHRS